MSTFFTDRNLGHAFPDLLLRSGIAVEIHDDHFKPDTSDVKWLRVVGKRGWFVLTHDSRIRYRPNERDAVMAAHVGLFVLVGQAPHPELATNFIATVAAVERFIARNPRPFIAKIHRATQSGQRSAGTVGMWLSEDDWRRGRRA